VLLGFRFSSKVGSSDKILHAKKFAFLLVSVNYCLAPCKYFISCLRFFDNPSRPVDVIFPSFLLVISLVSFIFVAVAFILSISLTCLSQLQPSSCGRDSCSILDSGWVVSGVTPATIAALAQAVESEAGRLAGATVPKIILEGSQGWYEDETPVESPGVRARRDACFCGAWFALSARSYLI